ncbi:pulmonary surfactant-associated protein A-like [Grus japonensis]|uniref:Pulmonary surfactant-associated protein A-like n=2 Tax=Grus TaxID=9114 RepID=A0ABC9X3T6_GRUJA
MINSLHVLEATRSTISPDLGNAGGFWVTDRPSKDHSVPFEIAAQVTGSSVSKFSKEEEKLGHLSLLGEQGKWPQVLALTGKISEVGEKILASNGKEVDFASALEFCEKAGGTLAAPRNEEENKAILGIVKQYNRYAYLGIREGETSGQFMYIDDTPLNYTKWHPYEPNGKGTEKCVEMYTDGSWNDKNCNLYRLTICEF